MINVAIFPEIGENLLYFYNNYKKYLWKNECEDKKIIIINIVLLVLYQSNINMLYKREII